jgi:hypothetical protein
MLLVWFRLPRSGLVQHCAEADSSELELFACAEYEQRSSAPGSSGGECKHATRILALVVGKRLPEDHMYAVVGATGNPIRLSSDPERS